MIDKYFSHYLGIVVQNNDPEKRGRLKVFVPSVNKTVYTDWDSLSTDKKFIFLDEKTNPDLNNILSKLKEDLPWAEIAMPFFGGSASGRYNAYTKFGTTSDSNYWHNDTYVEGFRPLQNYVNENRPCDAFTNSKTSRFVNPHGGEYSPSNYSNLARGLFTIPNVGSHVWIFFQDGDPQYPVVWSISYGVEDWKRIYSNNSSSEDISEFTSFDYPESYENLASEDNSDKSSVEMNHNIKTFRSKHVFNSNKHSLEFVDTDKKEMLKLTHYSGSFKEFNNFTNSELATNNDQKLVLGDQFYTVKRNQSIFVANHQDNIIHGDRYLTIGNYDIKHDNAQRILKLLSDLHEYKLLFEIMITKPIVLSRERLYVNTFLSKYQNQVGEPDICPVCGGAGEKLGAPCITCLGSGVSPSTQNGLWEKEAIKWEIEGKEWMWYDSENKTWNKVAGDLVWNEEKQTWINMSNSKPTSNEAGLEEVQNPNDWTHCYPPADVTENFILLNKIRETQRELFEYEAKWGEGGDSIENISGNKIVTIGTVFNDLKSFRRDPVGKIRDNGAYIAPMGTYVCMDVAPVLEYVDVDSVPGGDYNLTVGNKYTLNVGSKGIQIKTTGPLDITGAIVTFTGDQINMGSANEIVIDGGERLDLRAKIITLSPNYSENNRHAILADGNLGVRDNLTVVGGTMLEGELHFLHLTSVEEKSLTDIGLGPLPHRHEYAHPPWQLLEHCEDVRMKAMRCNEGVPVVNDKCPGCWVPGFEQSGPEVAGIDSDEGGGSIIGGAVGIVGGVLGGAVNVVGGVVGGAFNVVGNVFRGIGSIFR